MTSAIDVLPCPFCGQMPEVGVSRLSGAFKIRCVAMTCLRPEVSETNRRRKRAIEQWNMREGRFR